MAPLGGSAAHILLGGIGSLAGPIVGAFAFTALGEIAQQVTERKLLVEGVVILVAVLVLRNGIMGLRAKGPGMADPKEGFDFDAAGGPTNANSADAGGGVD